MFLRTSIDPTLNAEMIAYTGGAYSVPLLRHAQPCPGGLIYNGPVDKVIDKQIAAFGEINFKLTDTLKATVGLRVSKLDYTGSVAETGPFLGHHHHHPVQRQREAGDAEGRILVAARSRQYGVRQRVEGLSPGRTQCGRGSICGGDLASLGLPVIGGQRQVPGQFSSDSLWSYEIGSKNTFLDHRLQINASACSTSTGSTFNKTCTCRACGEQFTANLGKAKSEGGKSRCSTGRWRR